MSQTPKMLKDLGALAGAIMASGVSVVAPSAGPGPSRFRRLASAEELAMPRVNTQLPPKEHLFPPTEPLLRFRYRGTDVELTDPPLPAEKLVLLGVRPCDAAGIALLDAVFLADPTDPFYAARRANATIVAVGCARADDDCFCTAVGLSPHSSHGSDLLLLPAEGGYLAEAVTDKGRQLVAAHASLFTDAASARAAAPPKLQRASLDGVDEQLQAAFADARWAAIAARCLGCACCASVCPTCHCFDIADEASARSGLRLRSWDACGLEMFTKHTSGHNPRPNQPARFRQRVMHKLSYSVASLGRPLCVGCGRCISHCPVGMDIHQAAAQFTTSG
jgi:ferredoxin